MATRKVHGDAGGTRAAFPSLFSQRKRPSLVALIRAARTALAREKSCSSIKRAGAFFVDSLRGPSALEFSFGVGDDVRRECSPIERAFRGGQRGKTIDLAAVLESFLSLLSARFNDSRCRSSHLLLLFAGSQPASIRMLSNAENEKNAGRE